jgi:predicted transcriptional regulator
VGKVNLSNIDKYVIEKVRERRQELDISQAKLAIELDVSDSFIGNIESPKHPSHWNIGHLNELAKVLDCSPKDFVPKEAL